MSVRKSSYSAHAVQAISADIMIMTRREFEAETNKAFLAGVERGRFEERCAQPSADATPTPVPRVHEKE